MTAFAAGCAVGALAMFVTLALVFAVARWVGDRRTVDWTRADAIKAQTLANRLRSHLLEWDFPAPPIPRDGGRSYRGRIRVVESTRALEPLGLDVPAEARE